jgi:hypothetical protein
VSTQPTPTISDADVERVVGRDFPPASKGDVFAILAEYGTEDWHREIDRVRIAALKLAAGDIDRLRAAIATARLDYRDVLAPAEYPEYSRKVVPSETLSAEDKQRIIDSDLK